MHTQDNTTDATTASGTDVGRALTASRFGSYRKPTDNTIPKFEAIQKASLDLALMIYDLCPNSEEKYNALNLLQMAKMSANAAIAVFTTTPPTDGIERRV